MSIYIRNDFPGLNTLDPIQFFAIAFGVLTVVLIIAGRIAKAPFGLALSAARQNAERVETVGLGPFRLRLVAFVISGAVTGLAGALFADLNRFVSPTMFSWQTSGEIMVFVILGGCGAAFRPGGGGGAVYPAGASAGGAQRILARLSGASAFGGGAFRPRRPDRHHGRSGGGT